MKCLKLNRHTLIWRAWLITIGLGLVSMKYYDINSGVVLVLGKLMLVLSIAYVASILYELRRKLEKFLL